MSNKNCATKKSKGFINYISKTLSKCKNHIHSSTNADYQYISYGTDDSLINTSDRQDIQTPQACSTMYQSNIQINNNEIFPKSDRSQVTLNNTSISIYISEEQLIDQFLHESSDTTSNGSLSSISNITSEDSTIMHNHNESYKMVNSFDSGDSYEYLQSTQIPNSNNMPQIDLGVNELLIIDSLLSNTSRAVHGVNPSHACIKDYDVTFNNDLTVSFGDSVEVLRDDNEEWAFVQRASDGSKGYVPRDILLELNTYVSRLKLHRTISDSVNV